ncbi:hypothetical protein M378DRAFT_656589 [Amanita muscaria Koide BX008]|uniref:Polymerase beta nucleotidyltransferase domain-containing protein n=1 Tax=Amanita muscaria (strain Koide BX008) TaxID=946122 RepID=A0A0C2SKJ1_AMAMK|nr:hypothetical protein M378DRAFT_656589 [Amanita muscaria Koide BX008]
MTQPHTSPPSSSPPPAHSLSSPLDPAIPISAIPTTQLSLDRLSTLCRPVFEEERSRNPVIAWAGIFGSVQRGTQRPDSDVDFLVGYAADAEFCADVCGSYTQLQRRLPEILGREVDLVVFKQDSDNFGYVHLEALLTAETIWGDPSWVHSSREAAERLLREGYETSKKALQVASRLYERLPSSRVSIDPVLFFDSSQSHTTGRIRISKGQSPAIFDPRRCTVRHNHCKNPQASFLWCAAALDAVFFSQRRGNPCSFRRRGRE